MDQAPPGINHDEASNGYDGYSLLETGRDRWGKRWPVVLEAFGRADHRGALYAYLTVPFHAVLGPDHLTVSTRLPAAVVGIATVACTYWTIAKLSGVSVGLWASFFLTLSPWHLQLSRFGHESSLTPALTILAMACLVRGGVLLNGVEAGERLDSGASRISTRWLALGAAVFGIGGYSYPSMRLFTPIFVLLLGWFCRDTFRNMGRTSVGRRSLIVAVVTGGLILLPLISLCVTNWADLTARARQVSLFHQSDSIGGSMESIIRNYASHWGASWLLFRGDPYWIQWPGRYGVLNGLVTVFLVIGMVSVARDVRRKRLHGLLLAWLVIYPLPAALSIDGAHLLRSACGLPVLQWVAAIGCQRAIVTIFRSCHRQCVAVCLIALAVLGDGVWRWDHYFTKWSRSGRIMARYQEDLCRAVRAIRPIMGDYDRVFISDQVNQERGWFSGEAYIIVSLILPVKPADFQEWEKDVHYVQPSDGFHRVGSFGPFIMTTRADVLSEHFLSHREQSAVMIARPGEIQGGRLLETIRDDEGEARFEIIAVRPQ